MVLAGSRATLRSAAAGEIVDVPGGGRIVRSAAGRKDRHSKVCTAKGPRDRRVRLAAHTAIQFYDVQDRLGYDRPSKAVDWLMMKAKSAIDALDDLPAWNPVTRTPDGEPVAEPYDDSSLLPTSMESDSISDTIKSFFPMVGEGSAAGPVTSVGAQAIQFQNYPSSELLPMRECNQSQDLKLSLHSLHAPLMIQSHRSQQSQQEDHRSHFPEAAPIGFGHPSSNWDDDSQQPTDSGRFQRLIGWSFGGHGGGGGLTFLPPPHTLLQQQQQLLSHGGGHNSSHLMYPQGGPLQSNLIPLATATSSQDHHHDQSVAMHPMSFPGLGFGSSGGFLGFRIQGDDEEQDGNSNRPFSLSSGARH